MSARIHTGRIGYRGDDGLLVACGATYDGER